jgi:c-di-GMP-binding flagellar brake protein YcgR
MSRRRQHARVYLPEFGGIPAIVDIEADHASALLLARPIRALTNAIGEPVTVELTTERGLLHFDARIAGAADGEELVLDELGNSQIIQRRKYTRVDAVLEVNVTPLRHEGDPLNGSTLNISGSGAVVSRLGALKAGDGLEIALQLQPGSAAIVAEGRVVRAFGAGDGLRAVHFEQLLDADREQIVRFVFDRQRGELERMRRLGPGG